VRLHPPAQECIALLDEHRLVFEELAAGQQRAAEAAVDAPLQVLDVEPQIAAVADGLLDRAGRTRLGEDDGLADARLAQRLEVVEEDRPIRDGEQMLGLDGRRRPGAVILPATHQNKRLCDLHTHSNGRRGPPLLRRRETRMKILRAGSS
jgi:hypothetical protein